MNHYVIKMILNKFCYSNSTATRLNWCWKILLFMFNRYAAGMMLINSAIHVQPLRGWIDMLIKFCYSNSTAIHIQPLRGWIDVEKFCYSYSTATRLEWCWINSAIHVQPLFIFNLLFMFNRYAVAIPNPHNNYRSLNQINRFLIISFAELLFRLVCS